MFPEWTNGDLAAGLECYRRAEFFEAHEHWELVWLKLAEPEKSFLQALIQVSAAMHHYRNGNVTGAVSLLTRALQRLEQCDAFFAGIALEPLREGVREWLRCLDTGAIPDAVPEIRLVERRGEML